MGLANQTTSTGLRRTSTGSNPSLNGLTVSIWTQVSLLRLAPDSVKPRPPHGGLEARQIFRSDHHQARGPTRLRQGYKPSRHVPGEQEFNTTDRTAPHEGDSHPSQNGATRTHAPPPEGAAIALGLPPGDRKI